MTVARAAVFALFTSAMGCIPAVQNRVAESAIAGRRVTALPPQVLVYELDAYEHHPIDRRAARTVAEKVEPLLQSIMAANAGRLARPDTIKECGAPCIQFLEWGGLATLEIGLQREQVRNYGRHSVGDWEYRRDLDDVRDALEADFVLFVVFKQTRQTPGGRLLNGSVTGKQVDAACVLDLWDGRMSWCTSIKDDEGDIAEPGRIPAVLNKLLVGVFRVPWRAE